MIRPRPLRPGPYAIVKSASTKVPPASTPNLHLKDPPPKLSLPYIAREGVRAERGKKLFCFRLDAKKPGCTIRGKGEGDGYQRKPFVYV